MEDGIFSRGSPSSKPPVMETRIKAMKVLNLSHEISRISSRIQQAIDTKSIVLV
jgi:hypothetical protein